MVPSPELLYELEHLEIELAETDIDTLAMDSSSSSVAPSSEEAEDTPDTLPESQHKDIGEYKPRLRTEIPRSLESCEQEILQQIRSVIGDKEVSESKLHFAPPWIIEKAKARE